MSSIDSMIEMLQNSLKICRVKDEVCKLEKMNQNLQQKLIRALHDCCSVWWPVMRRLIFVLIVKIIKEIECEKKRYFSSVINFDGLVVWRSVRQNWLTKWLCTYYGLQLRCFDNLLSDWCDGKPSREAANSHTWLPIPWNIKRQHA